MKISSLLHWQTENVPNLPFPGIQSIVSFVSDTLIRRSGPIWLREVTWLASLHIFISQTNKLSHLLNGNPRPLSLHWIPVEHRMNRPGYSTCARRSTTWHLSDHLSGSLTWSFLTDLPSAQDMRMLSFEHLGGKRHSNISLSSGPLELMYSHSVTIQKAECTRYDVLFLTTLIYS